MRACGEGAHTNAIKRIMCNISLNENSHVWIPRGVANIGFFLNLRNHSCTFIFCLHCTNEKFEKYGWLQQSSVLIIFLSLSYVLLLQNANFRGSCSFENKLMSLQAHCDHKTYILSKVIFQELDLKTI